MCACKAEPLRDYVTRWTELRNSYEGVHEVQAIQYFIDGCRDGILLKHKLMCAEPTSLAVLMAKADKYATADSAMRIKVTSLDKVVPTPATPKPARDSRGGQNNYKRKADEMDPRSNSKLVANVEGEASLQAASTKRPNRATPSAAQQSSSSCRRRKIHSGRRCLAIPSTKAARRPSGGWLAGLRAQRRLHAPTTLCFRHRRLAMTAPPGRLSSSRWSVRRLYQRRRRQAQHAPKMA
ncbi:hypothetical protein ZWY2020_003592 [Hordeum vulgare]|nr:hypothetical protein ZWY2020_003592 [Hordeum vulgare]